MTTARRRLPAAAALLVVLVLGGACQSPPERPPPATPQTDAAAAPAPAPDSARYLINAEASHMRLLVYRAGLLAHLGHNHVIEARALAGHVDLAPRLADTQFALRIPVSSLVVDAAEARAGAGEDFVTPPDEDAIAGTTRNLLGPRVLDAAVHPHIDIHSLSIIGTPAGADIGMRIRLRGLARDIVVPTRLAITPQRITAHADFKVKQSDLGMTPLSVLGGALQVADAIDVRISLVAERNIDCARSLPLDLM
jgi:polyisoprenoid-binding protein YceI